MLYIVTSSSKTQSVTKVKKAKKVVGGIASKEPKTGLPCPRPISKDMQKELVELKEKYGALEAQYRKLLNELEGK